MAWIGDVRASFAIHYNTPRAFHGRHGRNRFQLTPIVHVRNRQRRSFGRCCVKCPLRFAVVEVVNAVTRGNRTRYLAVVIDVERNDAIATIEDFDLDVKVARRLTRKLDRIVRKIAYGKPTTACKQLKKFVDVVIKQQAKGNLTQTQADELVPIAVRIRSVLNCR